MAKSGSLGGVFERLVTLCQRNLYETVASPGSLNTNTLNFSGPCGTLLRNNILREWMDSKIKSDEIIFGTSAFTTPEASGNPTVSDRQKYLPGKETFSKRCLANYPNLLQFLNGRLPFGLTECGLHVNDGECPILKSDNVTPADCHFPVRLTSQRMHMLLHFYSPPRVASQWYNTWQRRRLSWWKHFSGTPSNFQSTNVQTSNGYQLVEIQYKFPWGLRTIETICNYGTEPVQLLSEEMKLNCQGKDGRKTVYPCVIEVVTSIEAAILTYIMDATKEKVTKDGASKLVLCLHSHLAPYKVSIANSGTSSQMKDIMNFLTRELRNTGITVLDLPDNSSVSLEQQFIRYDEMGIPYCIVLNEGTLKNGILGLRNRDTTLREQLHVSQVSQILYKYICSNS